MRRDTIIFFCGNGLLALLILLIMSSAETHPKVATDTFPYPDLQGHRGCRGWMPENTIAGMQKAIELGVTTLEMDVVITADGEVLLSHEPFFSHEISTAPDGRPVNPSEERQHNIYRMTYADTKAWDVGLRPHPRFPRQKRIAANKPLLTELIDSIEANQRNKVRYNIETKCLPHTDGLYHPTPGVFAEKVARLVLDKGIAGRTTIQSFDVRTLQYLHRHYPKIPLALLIEEDDRRSVEIQIKRLGFVPFAFSPHHGLVNEETVRTCRQQSMKLIPWTVNEQADMQRLLDMGVDGLISDYPDRFVGLRIPGKDRIRRHE